MPAQIVIEDREFLKMITKGYASAYTISGFMKMQAEIDEKQPIISYKNVAERLLRLARDGLIEVAETDERSIHGRKDYRLTWNGIINLMSSLDKEDIKTLIDYISKTFGDESFGQGLVGVQLIIKFNDLNILLQEYSEHINIPELKQLKRTLIKYLASNELENVYKAVGLELKPLEQPMREHIMGLTTSRPEDIIKKATSMNKLVSVDRKSNR